MKQQRTGAMQRAILDYLEITGPVLLHPFPERGDPQQGRPGPASGPRLTDWPTGAPAMARTTQAERRAIAGLQRKGRVVVESVTYNRLAWLRLALAGDAE